MSNPSPHCIVILYLCIPRRLLLYTDWLGSSVVLGHLGESSHFQCGPWSVLLCDPYNKWIPPKSPLVVLFYMLQQHKMSAKWQEKRTGTPQHVDYSKMVDALKIVVVRREQILANFYILSITIGLANIKQHICNCIFCLIHSFIEFFFQSVYTISMTSGRRFHLECGNMDTDYKIVDYGYYM